MKKFMIIVDGDGDGYATYLTKRGDFSSKSKGVRFFSEQRAHKFLAKQPQYIQEVALVAEV